MKSLLGRVVLPLVLVLLSHATMAQSVATGTISGTVRDSSGAVLPGVTVEAASPALIEKSRSVATDGQGVYRIIDLRPGTYTVTFTLQGFSTVRREGVELTTGFTAAVNADLAVGDLKETITVSGATPVESPLEISCGVPGHDRPGEELRTESMQVNDSPLIWGVQARCGFATSFAYHSED